MKTNHRLSQNEKSSNGVVFASVGRGMSSFAMKRDMVNALLADEKDILITDTKEELPRCCSNV